LIDEFLLVLDEEAVSVSVENFDAYGLGDVDGFVDSVASESRGGFCDLTRVPSGPGPPCVAVGGVGDDLRRFFTSLQDLVLASPSGCLLAMSWLRTIL